MRGAKGRQVGKDLSRIECHSCERLGHTRVGLKAVGRKVRPLAGSACGDSGNKGGSDGDTVATANTANTANATAPAKPAIQDVGYVTSPSDGAALATLTIFLTCTVAESKSCRYHNAPVRSLKFKSSPINSFAAKIGKIHGHANVLAVDSDLTHRSRFYLFSSNQRTFSRPRMTMVSVNQSTRITGAPCDKSISRTGQHAMSVSESRHEKEGI